MSKLPMVMTLAAMGWLTGCAPLASIRPLATKQDAITDPAFAGTWREGDSENIWRIREAEDSTYEFQKLGDDHDKGKIRLVKLGGQLYADIWDDSETIPAHFFGRVRLEGDDLYLALLSSTWLKEQVVRNNDPRHERLGEGEVKDSEIILTATTAELKKFMLKYAAAPQAFEEEGVFHRVK